MLYALCPSRPEVGSSKNRSNSGLAASSTPIVTRFRATWDQPLCSAYRHRLITFNRKTVVRETNHGISQLLEFKKFDDVLHIIILFLFRNVLRLTKISRVLEGLSNGCSPFVSVLLFSIGTTSLEIFMAVRILLAGCEQNNLPVPMGRPFIKMSPSTTPMFFLDARTSSKVVLPAPEAPMRAVRDPGLT